MGALVVVLMAIVSVAACGSSSSSSKSASATTAATTTAPPPVPTGARGHYVAQADALCRAAEPQVEALEARVKQEAAAHNAAALINTVNQALAVGSALDAKLRTLKAPPQIQPVVNRYLAARATEIALYKQLISSAQRHDQSAVQSLDQQLERVKVARHSLSRQIGYQVC